MDTTIDILTLKQIKQYGHMVPKLYLMQQKCQYSHRK